MLEVIRRFRFQTYRLVLALSTGVRFCFNIPLTIASAAVALSASFVAFGSDVMLELLKRRRFRHFLPLNSPDHDSYMDDESSVDLMSREVPATPVNVRPLRLALTGGSACGLRHDPDLLGD